MAHDRDDLDHDRDQMDCLLDRLLKQYGEVEPRPGLENRILARVRAEASRTRWPQRWAWSLAGAGAAVLLVVMWSGIVHRTISRPEETARSKTPNPTNVAQSARVTPANARSASHPQAPGVHRAVRYVARRREPRLDQFPSPRPLSRQEIALANYAQRFPEEAMLVAKQQAQFEEEIQKAEKEFEKSSPVSDQER